MGKQHIQLYDARYAYQSGYDLDQKMHEGDCQSGYVFLFQGNWQEDMQFWGNVLMFEIQVLLKDMERHTIFPSQTICKEFSAAKQHYVTFSEELKKNAYSILDIDLLEELNQQYLKSAKHPQGGFSRISRDMAKQMILSGDTPVYRLLPEGPEKITLFAAVMTGLWYESYQEFAIRTDDLSAIYNSCYKELVRFIRGKIGKRNSTYNQNNKI